MPLNIKDYHVHEQARRIAELTGESLTEVVRLALNERLSAVQKRKMRPIVRDKAEQLMVLGRLCAAHVKPDNHSSDHAQLYGDDGMPQ